MVPTNVERKLNHVYQETAVLRKLMADELTRQGHQLESISKALADLRVDLPDGATVEIRGLEETLASAKADMSGLQKIADRLEEGLSLDGKTVSDLSGAFAKALPEPKEQDSIRISNVDAFAGLFPKSMTVTGRVTADTKQSSLDNPTYAILTDGTKIIPLERLLKDLSDKIRMLAQGLVTMSAGGFPGQANEMGIEMVDKTPVYDEVIIESGNYSYLCHAAAGSSESEAKWRIQRIDTSVAGKTVKRWAGGTTAFKWKASQAASLTY